MLPALVKAPGAVRLRPLARVKLPAAALAAKLARAFVLVAPASLKKLELAPLRTMLAALVAMSPPTSRRVLLANTFHVPPVRVPAAKLLTVPWARMVPPFWAAMVPWLVQPVAPS